MHRPVNYGGQLLLDLLGTSINALIGQGYPQPGEWRGQAAMSTLLFGDPSRWTWSQATDTLFDAPVPVSHRVDVPADTPLGRVSADWLRRSEGVPAPPNHRAAVVGGQAKARGRSPLRQPPVQVGIGGGGAPAAAEAGHGVAQASARELFPAPAQPEQGQFAPVVGGKPLPSAVRPVTLPGQASLPLPGLVPSAAEALRGQAMAAQAAATALPASRPVSPAPPGHEEELDTAVPLVTLPVEAEAASRGILVGTALPGVPLDVRVKEMAGQSAAQTAMVGHFLDRAMGDVVSEQARAARAPGQSDAPPTGQSTASLWGGYTAGQATAAARGRSPSNKMPRGPVYGQGPPAAAPGAPAAGAAARPSRPF